MITDHLSHFFRQLVTFGGYNPRCQRNPHPQEPPWVQGTKKHADGDMVGNIADEGTEKRGHQVRENRFQLHFGTPEGTQTRRS